MWSMHFLTFWDIFGPNTKNILQQLIDRGVDLYLLSASHQNTLNDLVEYYSIKQFFNAVSGVNNYIADGKIVNGHKLLKTLDAPNKEIILIGDTDHDLEVANSLNIECILLSCGHQSSAILKNISNNVIDNLSDLF